MWHRWLLAIVFAAACAPAVAQPSRPPAFLTQWHVARTGIKTDIKGSLIRVSKSDGWISTDGEYLDFVLHLRYRATTDDAEGALLLRAWQQGLNAFPRTGYRVALGGPAARRPPALVMGLSAPAHAASPDPDAVIRTTAGHWHDLEVRCQEDQVSVDVDGTRIGVYEGFEPQAGTIGIEAVKGVIEYDQMQLTVIEPGVGVTPSDAASGSAGETQKAARPGDGVSLPRAVHQLTPRYTARAMKNKIQGTVIVQAIVEADGRVGDVRIVKALDCDLDLEAVAAARRWFFEPGRKGDAAVPVVVTIELAFKLR